MAGMAGIGGTEAGMDLFRSEEMQLVQLIIPAEAAHRTVSCLGDLGLLQFKDVRSSRLQTPHTALQRDPHPALQRAGCGL